MKRLLAATVLLSALAMLAKLAPKPTAVPDRSATAQRPSSARLATETEAPHREEADAVAILTAKYQSAPARDRDLVVRVGERFGRNACAIQKSDGLRGLVLLDRLDIEAIFLYEKHPDEFRRLRESLGTDAAADVLLHWREYFGLKHADDADRTRLIAEVARLTPSQQKIAARFPAVLPLILAEPGGMSCAINRLKSDERALADALAILCFMSLEAGPR